MELAGSGGRKYHPAQILIPLLGENIAGNIRKVRPKAHQFSASLGSEALSRAEIRHCFQKVGLTLGIVAHDQIDTFIKFQSQLPVITEVLKDDLIQRHTW